MDYRQYTSCVAAKDHLKLNQYLRVALEAFLAGAIGVLIALAAGEPWCLIIVAEIMVMQGTLAYCHWWLEDRLICLDGDQTVVGVLISVEPPESKTDFFDKWDTDYSINLLPPPNPIGAGQSVVEESMPYGYLVKEQKSTRDAGLPFKPEAVKEDASGKESAVLHAEFEGAGVKDVLLGAQIGLGLSVAALILCLSVIGVIVAAILAFLAFLAWLIGLIVGRGDKGSPGDVNPALGDLHTNENGADGKGRGADILFVGGRWVYDAGHNNKHKGWNELHAIKYCTRVDRWDGDWPKDLGDLVAQATDQYGKTTSSLTVDQQQRPENQWEVHPLIDGCEPEGPPAVIR